MQQILPGVWYFTGLIAGRVYLIQDPDGFTIIDTGLELAAPRILSQVAALGHQPSAIKRILLTHAHPDHAGGLPKLKAATGAQVWTSPTERPVVEGRQSIPRAPREQLSGLARLLVPPDTRLKPTPVDREIRDGERLPEVMGGIQVVETPGHSPGHLAFWHPDKGILFCGDVLFNAPNLRQPPRFFTVDTPANQRSIRRLASLNPTVVCFGHGNPLTANAAQTLQNFIQKLP